MKIMMIIFVILSLLILLGLFGYSAKLLKDADTKKNQTKDPKKDKQIL